MIVKASHTILLFGFTILLVCSGCKKNTGLNLYGQDQQVIAIQPFNNFEIEKAIIISKELSTFYKKRVIVLPMIGLPSSYMNPIVQQYSGDSILLQLSKLTNDSIVEVIGLTHYPVYTLKGVTNPYFDTHIFGAGHQPGKAAIISDVRFNTEDTAIYYQRFRNIIIHEVGHNMGLAHCADSTCVMSENNGNIAILDKGKNDYCSHCRKLLQWLQR